MSNKSLWLTIFAAVVVHVMGPIPAYSGSILWTGDAGDNRWDNPDNWLDEILPSELDRAVINGPDAGPGKGPIIDEGTDAVTEVLISEAGVAHMSMTGGSLELTGWGSWWGDGEGNHATFDMSGGTIEYFGNPGIFEMSWRPSEAPSGSSTGIWNMTGGEIFALGVSMPATDGETAVVNLDGGTFNVGTARGGLTLREGALIDITEGQMILEGDQESIVEDYIADDWIVGYGGDGNVIVTVEDDFTIITASGGFPLGDFNKNGALDSPDINDLTRQSAMGLNPLEYDLNDDDLVNAMDVDVWVKELLGSWMGDANLDGEFNTNDLVSVFQGGKFETKLDATWSLGDWNGDGQFTTGDLVTAFQDGGFERGPRDQVASIPEPTTATPILIAILILGVRFKNVGGHPKRMAVTQSVTKIR